MFTEIYVAIDEAMLVNGAKSSFVIDEDSKIFDLATLAFPASVLAFAEKLSFRTYENATLIYFYFF